MAERFKEPELVINRVYTRTGDQGLTRLVGGQKTPKHDLRIESYGTVDELNAHLGAARLACLDAALPALAKLLLRAQHTLFNLGSLLATLPADLHPRQPRVEASDTLSLEQSIDRCTQELTPLRSFVLPGGNQSNVALHLARTVCRRAERLVVLLAEREPVDGEAIKYLNRLSDALFVWSRVAIARTGGEELLWQANLSD